MADIQRIKTELAYRAESICRELLPNGKKQGHEWVVGSIEGEEGDSLGVHLNGGKPGIFCDFANGEDRGDLLDLYCAVKKVSLAEALKWAKDYLGIQEHQFSRAIPKRQFKTPNVMPGTRTPKSEVLKYLTEERKLSEATIKVFQIAEMQSRKFKLKDDEYQCPAIVFPFKSPDEELKMLKYLGIERPNGKRLFAVSLDSEPRLFGWQVLDKQTRVVVIEEGEINAMSLYEYGISSLSTPFGAGSGNKHEWLSYEWENLDRFEVIYLRFDDDDAGKLAVKELVDRLGRHRVLILPNCPQGLKDPNDCLQAGVTRAEMWDWLSQAKSQDPEELRDAVEFKELVIEQFHPANKEQDGIPFPIESLKNHMRTRLGELTVWSGFTGHGKTEFLNWLYANLLISSQLACIASFEMRGAVLLKRLVKQLTGDFCPNKHYISQVLDWLSGKLWIFDKVGRAKPEVILEVFRYARMRHGITHFALDSLMRCGIRSDNYPAQDEFAFQLATLCNDLMIHIDLVDHTRKQESDKVQLDTQAPKGSGGIVDQAHNLVIVSRNPKKDMALSKRDSVKADEPDGWIKIAKQREGDGWTGVIPVWFDRDCKQYYSNHLTIAAPLIEHDLTYDPENPYQNTDSISADF